MLDASGMIMPVTLDGGGGTDTLIGGAGDDTLIYSGPNNEYDGVGGTDNQLVFPTQPGDQVVFSGSSFSVDNGTPQAIPNTTNIEYYSVDSPGALIYREFSTVAQFPWTWSSSTSGASLLGKTVVNPLGYTETDVVRGTSSNVGFPCYVEQGWSNVAYNPATQGQITSYSIQSSGSAVNSAKVNWFEPTMP